ncbi:MAG: phage head-tail adapter protein [Planctomycetia bacterium]|nr:phage head-tail adapter protein [Planctomycetia bacterium]
MKNAKMFMEAIAAWFVAGLFCAAGVSYADECPAFLVLPEYVATPDGMAVCQETGDLIVACPNFGDDSKPACILRINKNGQVRKWFEVPVSEETGKAYPMGIDFAPDGALFICDNQNWPTGNGEKGEVNQGRLIRVVLEGDKIVACDTIVSGIPHPNGVKVRDGYAYITVSCLPQCEQASGLLASGVYRFPLEARNVEFSQKADDPNLFVLLETENKDCQYGADGLCFDDEGNLYIGNFGDGTLLKATPNGNGGAAVEVYAKCESIPPLMDADGKPDAGFLAKATQIPMRTTDGICRDAVTGDIYVADFSNNAIAKVSGKDCKIAFIAKSGDSNGLNGELNQPGEPCFWNGHLAVTCFDMVDGPDKVNTSHDSKATIVFLPLETRD